MSDHTTLHLGHIDYLNTLPLEIGYGTIPDEVKIVRATPSVLNGMIDRGELDISPVSSVYYIEHREALVLLGGLSISSNGPVMSVVLYSRLPLGRLDRRDVAVTVASTTSVEILQSMFAMEGVSPGLRPIESRTDARDADAVLLIGDDALHDRNNSWAYQYDLGEEWHRWTGLPAVFAVWVARRSSLRIYDERIGAVSRWLLDALDRGLADRDKIVDEAMRRSGLSRTTLAAYYERLDYRLTDEHLRAIEELATKIDWLKRGHPLADARAT